MYPVQEDKGRVNVFISYSSRHSTKLFELLFPMLHDEDSFIGHQARYTMSQKRAKYFCSVSVKYKPISMKIGRRVLEI